MEGTPADAAAARVPVALSIPPATAIDSAIDGAARRVHRSRGPSRRPETPETRRGRPRTRAAGILGRKTRVPDARTTARPEHRSAIDVDFVAAGKPLRRQGARAVTPIGRRPIRRGCGGVRAAAA